MQQDANTFGYPASTQGALCTLDPSFLFEEPGADLLDMTTHISGRGIIKTRLDGTEGQSGSPVFACPDAPCSGNDSPLVYGILAQLGQTNSGTPIDVRGPKTPGTLRTWALGILP